MKAVISTVSSASVTVDGKIIAEVQGPALLALVGVGREDSAAACDTVARKIAELRLFPATDESWDGHRTYSAADVGAEILLVSQFTLMGATAKGRRPSWAAAAPGADAEPVMEQLAEALRARDLVVKTGEFGAMMSVASVNEGPFTVLVEAE